jgi:hypothetical protein
VLLEREQELGGQARIARRAPSRQDFDGACRYAALQCAKLGVDIRLGVHADVETVLAESPEVVLLATGARPHKPAIRGIDDYGYSAWEVLEGVEVPGQRILVADEEYGHQGPSTAEYLLDHGKEVEVVTTEATVGNRLGATTLPPVLQRLYSKGATIRGHVRLVGFDGGMAIAENVWSNRPVELGLFDALVYCFGGESVCDLQGPLEGRVPQLMLLGDCFAPRTLQHAILEGHRAAREI